MDLYTKRRILVEVIYDNMAATAQNVSFASPLADAKFAQLTGSPQFDSFLTSIGDLGFWKIALTILFVLVAYDQCMNGVVDWFFSR